MTDKPDWKIVVLPVAFLLIVAFVAWTIFDYGRYRAGFDRTEVSMRQSRDQQRIEELEQQVADFRSRAVRLESAKKVDDYANQAVKDTLAEMESENRVLTEELEFYRQIVSPGKGRQGMHIHDFSLTQGLKGLYNYRLMLIHIQGTKKHHRESDGDVRISVIGQQNGVNKKLNFATISTEKKSRIRYRFKYFARFEGGLKLPVNFKPESIEIQVIPRQKNIKGDTRKIKWPATAG
jgi:hypothetical protein